jgi:protein disulfide-isomerase
MSALRRCGHAILALGMLSAWAYGQQQAYVWQTDLEAAKRLASQSNRLVLVHFTAPWCQPCARLEENVFKKPSFGAAIDPQYVGVKLNLDDSRKVAAQWGIQAIPADVILTSQGQVVQKLQSPPTMEQYVGVMQQIATRALPGAMQLAAASASPGQPAGQQPPLQPQAATPPGQAATPPVAAAPSAPPADDRYADYFASRGGIASGSSNSPATAPAASSAPPGMTAGNPPAAETQNPYASVTTQPASPPAATTPSTQYSMPNAMAGQQVTPPGFGQAPPGMSTGPQSDPSVALASRGRSVELPPGSPPLGLDGFCPVTLVERHVWKEGDVRFGAIHHGRTYLFLSVAEQQRFLANPESFSPVMSGDDPVLALDQNKMVPGQRRHGVFFGSRIYLFSSEATLAEFSRNPGRYAPEITQARREGNPQR